MSNFGEPIIPDEVLFEQVHLGHEAEKFLKHDPIGRALVDRATDEYKMAVVAFEDLTPPVIMSNPEKVLEIHYKMDAARKFLLWINQVIIGADRAEEELRARDDGESTID